MSAEVVPKGRFKDYSAEALARLLANSPLLDDGDGFEIAPSTTLKDLLALAESIFDGVEIPPPPSVSPKERAFVSSTRLRGLSTSIDPLRCTSSAKREMAALLGMGVRSAILLSARLAPDD